MLLQLLQVIEIPTALGVIDPADQVIGLTGQQITCSSRYSGSTK
jgi:hypothetical protein